MADFGYSTPGGTSIASFEPTATKFTAPGDGTIIQLSVYAASFASLTVRVAVYADSSGVPGAKLAESPGDVTVNSLTPAWFNLGGFSLPIVGGIVYWLAFWASDGANVFFYFDTGTTHQSSSDLGETYPTWPDPFGEAFALDRVYSIYANYTPAGLPWLPRQTNLQGSPGALWLPGGMTPPSKV